MNNINTSVDSGGAGSKSPAELERMLADCEAVLESYRQQKWLAAEALCTILDNRLFKLTIFADFSAYVETRWGYQRAYAYQLAKFGRVRRLLREELAKRSGADQSTIADSELPHTEGQARSLGKRIKQPAEMLKVWEAARRANGKSQPSQQEVEQQVELALAEFLQPQSENRPLATEGAGAHQMPDQPSADIPVEPSRPDGDIDPQTQAMLKPSLVEATAADDHASLEKRDSQFLRELKLQWFKDLLRDCGMDEEELEQVVLDEDAPTPNHALPPSIQQKPKIERRPLTHPRMNAAAGCAE